MSTQASRTPSRKRSRAIIIIPVLLAICVAGEYALDVVLERVVEQVFAVGTKCNVNIGKAELHLLSLSAEAYNNSIVCPHEQDGEGFKADYISIGVSLRKILGKLFVLEDLIISGASVKSIGKDSSLIRIIEFVAVPPKKAKGPAPWHAALTRGWKVELTGLEISSTPEHAFTTPERLPHGTVWDAPDVIVGIDKFLFAWKNVRFKADRTERKYPRTRLFARAGGFGLEHEAGGRISLGTVDAGVSVGGGFLRVLHAVVRSDNTPVPSTLRAFGGINIREQRYVLATDIRTRPDFLRRVFPSYQGVIDEHELHVDVTADMSGPLNDPNVSGDIRSFVVKPLPIFKRKHCALNYVVSEFKLTQDTLTLYDTNAADLIDRGTIQFELKDDYEFTADLNYVVSRDSAAVRRCLRGEAQTEQTTWFDTMLEEAVLNSRGIITGRGTLVPLKIRAKLQSQLHEEDPSARSSLGASLDVSGSTISIQAEERGAFPLPIKGLPEKSLALANEATQFDTANNANINISLTYDIESGAIKIPRAELERYPAFRLLGRLAPFVDDSTFTAARHLLTKETLVNASFDLSRTNSTAAFDGGGSVNLQSLRLLGVPFLSLAVPFQLSPDQVSIPNGVMKSQAGDLTFTLSSKMDSLDGVIELRGFDLSFVPIWNDIFPDIDGLLVGYTSISGTADDPVLEGEFQLQSSNDVEIPIDLISGARFTLKDNLFSGSAALLGERSKLTWSVPTSAGKTDKLNVNISANEFYIAPLLPEYIRSQILLKQKADSLGTISGEASYEASIDDPLAGRGLIELSKISLKTPAVEIKNKEPLRASIENRTLILPDSVLFAAERPLEISGSLGADNGWDMSLRSEWELATLAELLAPGSEWAGDMDLQVSVTGPLAGPVFDGSLRVDDAAASIGFGSGFVNADKISVDATLRDSSIELQSVSARIGNGRLSARGTIQEAFSNSLRNGAVEVFMTSIGLQPVDALSVRFSGFLRLLFDGDTPLNISGDVEVLRALYEQDLSLGALIRSVVRGLTQGGSRTSSRTVRQEGPSPTLAIRVFAEDSLRVESSILQTSLRGDVLVRGSIASPQLAGVITASEGSFGIGRTSFDILNGNVRFQENALVLDPQLSITAETFIESSAREEHRILVNVAGTASKPTVSLSSDTGLSEREIIALLNVGGSSDQVSLLFWDERARTDYTYAELVNFNNDISLSDRLRGLLGFSRVEIETVQRIETGELVPRVTGLREVTPGVEFQLYSDLSETDEQGARATYDLTPEISTFAEWRSVPLTETQSDSGSFGLGLRYRRSFPGTGIVPDSIFEGSP